MQIKDIGDKIKGIAIAYAVIGSLYMFSQDRTGHYSADLHLGKAQMSNLEKTIYTPIFKKLNIDTKLQK